MTHSRNALNGGQQGWITRLSVVSALFCIVMLSAFSASAQVDEGAITGTVTDTTGAAVPNASVTLTNTDVGLVTQSTTNSAGEYTFQPIRIGHYAVAVTANGFAKTNQQNLTVNVSQKLQVDVQMKLGAASETVEVTTAPPVLQTDDSSVGQTVTEQTIQALPLNGRNFTFLAQLGAGVQSSQADTRGNAASGAFSANGLRPAQNNYLLDGIDNNSNAVDFLNGTNYAVLPPLDAISEFKVQTADFSAEYGRSAGAVLNATTKSGTNSLHGTVWEFFRNDKLDASDFFDKTKSRLRQNQFGASVGGRIIKDKLFFFGDYEGLRRVQGQALTGNVPTPTEVSSSFRNLTDLLQTTSQTDFLGRSVPLGTVQDPATTRAVTAGQIDPVSGLTATTSGYVRDPFGTCPKTTLAYTAACGLNILPAARLDPVAIKLLSLYPAQNTAPTGGYNYKVSPNLFEHRNAFDVRVDAPALTKKDQLFARFSYVDDPEIIPGIFGGIADGGAFQQGDQTLRSTQTVVGYTHIFTPNTVNVLHVGFNHLHTTRFGPAGDQTGVPAQYGIQGIPQFSENGGLPTIQIGGLATLGSNPYLPSDETSQTLQIADDFTQIYKSHSFKAGIESQQVKFSVLQPAYSRGSFDFNGTYTDVPTKNNGGTGLAQFLLTPTATTVPGGLSFSGGSDQVQASNVNKTYDYRTYLAAYLQDDWKPSSKLTFNLGLRWDYFTPIRETNGGQANFVPSGPPNGVPTYLIPASGKDVRALSTSFTSLLAKDGIKLQQTDQYGQGLVNTQKTNFAPRVGFAYTASNKFVVRGGFGISYNAFENQGYGPNIGENYPFVFNFNYTPQTTGTNNGQQAVSPVSVNTPFAGCTTAGPGSTATIGSGLSCVQFTPTAVNAAGLGLEGLQFNYKTPLTYSANLSMQYSITRTMSFQAAYVFTRGQNLQTGIGSNNVTALLPAGSNQVNATSPGAGGTIPFPDFSQNMSYQSTIGTSNYNGLQTKLEKLYGNGLSFLLTYTYSKALTDALDLLNGGSVGGFRAPAVPGLGPSFDYGPADFDIRQVVHLSGIYELPFGHNKMFMSGASKPVNAVLGGWSVNWIVTLQGGQPLTIGCPTATTAGTNCNAVRVAGQDQKRNITISNGAVRWLNNPNAFNQPCQLSSSGPIGGSPAGCVPLMGSAALGDSQGTTVTPGFHRFDFSLFKNIPISNRLHMEFRSEFFNILNHPNFNAPGFGGNGVVSIANSTNFTNPNFGLIGSTRDNPYDPRQVQFALKLYY
jgi:hypothetical protein